jgi:hypothetical protein
LILYVDAPLQGFRTLLEVRSDLADVARMSNGTMFVRDNSDGEAHDGKLLVVPSAVD